MLLVDARRVRPRLPRARASCRCACGARSRASSASPTTRGISSTGTTRRNLQPLLPRYVSTVDSGNFAGCLVALEQGCREVAKAPILRAVAWEGLSDSLDLLEEALRLGRSAPRRPRCGRSSRRMRRELRGGARPPERRVRDVSNPLRRHRRPSSIASSSRCSRPARSATTPTRCARFALRWIASIISCGRCATRSTCCSPGSPSRPSRPPPR